MYHYYEALINPRGGTFAGFYGRVIDPATQAVVSIYSDDSGTPISTISGVADMVKTDDSGNASFYVAPGSYHFDIYSTDAATFLFRYADVGMGDGNDVSFLQAGTGAVPRSVQDKLRETISVPDLGAIADGVTNNSGSFINLWNEGGGLVPPAETVADVYLVNSTTPLDDMYGGSLVKRGTGYVTLPDTRVPYDTARKIMALFAEVRAEVGSMTLLGTSIDEGYHFAAPDGVELDWFTQLRNLFAFVTKDTNAETVTNFADPSRYGLTISGGAVFDGGPVGRAIVLQVGDYIEYTGAYAFNEVFAQHDPSNGKLQFTYNGGAVYKTIDCSGTAAPDVCSFQSTTASPVSGVHRITCIDNPVMVTGLARLNVAASATPVFTRMAVAATSTVNIMSHIASILRVGVGHAAGKSCFFVDHMVNEWQTGGQGLSAENYRANLVTLVKASLSAGHYVVLMSGMEPDAEVFAYNEEWPNYVAAMRSVAEEYDVPVIDMDVVDWLGKGLFQDGLHPNQAGALRRARIALEQLSRMPRLGSRLYPGQTSAFVLALGDEATAIAAGTGKFKFRAPYAFNLTQVRASVATASSSGNIQLDIKVGGVSALSGPIYLGATQTSSTQAAVQPVIGASLIADDAEVTIDIVAAGTGAAGLKVTLTGNRR